MKYKFYKTYFMRNVKMKAKKEHLVTKATIVLEPERESVQPAEQTTCPIMGIAIDKNVYTEYQGKKVYFCCAGCETPFLDNPEKYVSKLPQFNK
jgi:YHS domain-containing protein